MVMLFCSNRISNAGSTSALLLPCWQPVQQEGVQHRLRNCCHAAVQVSQLLGSPTWTGGGPGMMMAASQGALAVGGAVAAVKIGVEAGQNVRTASYLPPGTDFTCRFMASRKMALVGVLACCRACIGCGVLAVA